MKHPDEFTIEQYVLGQGDKKRKMLVQRHLYQCPGCREMEHRLRTFYENAENALRNPSEKSTTVEKSLTRRTQEIEIWDSYRARAFPNPPASLTLWQKAQGMIRQRPIASLFGSISMVGAIALIIAYSATDLFKDKNPSFVHYNIGAGMLEVFNKGNEKLWQMPSDFLEGAKEGDEAENMKSTIVEDLNGNGQNLVISNVRMASDKHGNSLRIVDGRMNVLAKVDYGVRDVQFRQQHYDAQFNPLQPIIVRTGESKSIIVLSNNGRSPCVVTRYDATGKVLGEYWHFGDLRGGYAVELGNDDKDELILIGSNDVGPGDGDNFPSIIVLDPSKISGESESALTRGFGYSASRAELYYIRLNLDQICHIFHSYANVDKLLSGSDDVLRFGTYASAPGHGRTFPNFEFVFDKHLNPLDVKNDDQTVREVERLKKQGKTSIVLNAAYREKIRGAIRYWDGKEWTKTATQINPGLAVR